MDVECDRFVGETTTPHAGFTRGLSSALSGDLLTDSNARSLPVLPSYPNGVGRASAKTPAFIRNAIPIRKLGDGMSDGLGRIRREIASSYHHRRRRRTSEEDSAEDDSVPLEFDEEDDFLSVATTTDDGEQVWDDDDGEMMDKFDDISVVGFLDEELRNE